eukprot:m.49015 g.49015  ORF g.49015 m.49015 type:complete len:79 (+) comp33954_c0_seq1:131-367(+)
MGTGRQAVLLDNFEARGYTLTWYERNEAALTNQVAIPVAARDSTSEVRSSTHADSLPGSLREFDYFILACFIRSILGR